MAGAPQQQQSQQDSGMGALWIAAVVILVIWGIWHFYHTQIVTFIIHVKLYEAYLVSLFTSSIDPLIQAIENLTPEAYGTLSVNQVFIVSEKIGKYYQFPILIFSLFAGVYIFKRSPIVQYRQKYTMETLVTEEEKNWPQITPVMKLDLIKMNIDEGPWASAMTPLQFVKKHKIFKTVPIETAEAILAHKTKYYVSLFSDQAHRVLSMQMGSLWNGIDALPIHMQALFSIFAARGAKDSKNSSDLLNQISFSSKSGKLNFSGTASLLKKYRTHKNVQKIISSHAYVLTVLASMLQLAREDGVLSSADFLWLKPLDRPLWYMLNTVGRKTPFIEVAGAYGHWKAELEFGYPIIVPMVNEAVKALDAALKEILYIPEE